MDRDREILERLDEHLARGNAYMARGNELMEEIREEHRLNREVYARTMETMLDLSERQERLVNEAVGAIREMREEIRAQTRAIFTVIDRLEGNGGPTAA